jgi:hypothetical protein
MSPIALHNHKGPEGEKKYLANITNENHYLLLLFFGFG